MINRIERTPEFMDGWDRRRTDAGDFTIFHNMDTRQFFYSIDHCQRVVEGDKMEGDGWVPVSFSLPMSTVPREGLEDGVIDTLRKNEMIFHCGDTEIPNPNPMYAPKYLDKDRVYA